MSDPKANVSIQVHTSDSRVQGANRSYRSDVGIGRSDDCDVQVSAEMVSRLHAELVFENDRWWVVDKDSTNGTYLDGERIEREPLLGDSTVQFGQNGPEIHLSTRRSSLPPTDRSTKGPRQSDPSISFGETASQSPDDRRGRENHSGKDPFSPSQDPSVSRYVKHYFEDDDRPVGEHTRMLRQAYQRVHEKQRRSYLWIVAGLVAVSVLAVGWVVVREWQLQRSAEDVLMSVRTQAAQIAELQRRIEESGAPLENQLAELEEKQRKQRQAYRGFVKELGMYRELTPKEKEIFRVARIFGESEFSIPAGFLRKVKTTINEYWLDEARQGFVRSIRRAERNRYIPYIVHTMQEHKLPPEFFYLALQESRLDTSAVGPRTRWGIAKGMWQFIPKTAQRYGLAIGPRAQDRVVDLQDERFYFRKSTRAAARYLQDIYSTEAQASGLLVIASYNWGEHRVVSKIEALFSSIPEEPDSRNYWNFLGEYSGRMPDETKDYVLKIFSAAVIGQNPRLFGFNFDNPLDPYTEAPMLPGVVSEVKSKKSDVSL